MGGVAPTRYSLLESLSVSASPPESVVSAAEKGVRPDVLSGSRSDPARRRWSHGTRNAKACRHRRRRVGAAPEPLAVARQVDPRHPPLLRPGLPVGRFRPADPDRVLRRALYGALPARNLRL